MSDIDEIPNPDVVAELAITHEDGILYEFSQRMFSGFLNVRAMNKFWTGTRACSGKTYKDLCNVRSHMTVIEAGWHWSFLGGEEEVQRKLHSYSHEEYDTEETHRQIAIRLANGEDVIGRAFRMQTVEIDETFPRYVREHKNDLAHLIK